MERGKTKETHHKDDGEDNEEKRNKTGLEGVARLTRRIMEGKIGRSKKRGSKRQGKDE